MQFSHIIEQSPHDWETTVCQNEVLTIFHTQNICMENSQNHTLMFCCSPIPGRRLEKQGKLKVRFFPVGFSPFHELFPAIGDQQCIAM